ncbi:putative ATPase [Caldisphaera lagunensis DSM 15908]|uniref:Putative ATPase n=1 Tax=Caldisphaera lagunensis (strain DSM 15908 / JCM 11604 / ANMR 0165 / IC-154) TaxID=1056495 RepID=L0AAR6_CALLD|nr:ATP-binding protein [Caldisphaera lagunensis]AFZ70976.1 putative ATPase [Caldisphaera lagunensis DSM 15908]
MIIDKVPRYLRPLIGLIGILIILMEIHFNIYKYIFYIIYILPLIGIPIILRLSKIKKANNLKGSYDVIEIEFNGSKEEKEEMSKAISNIVKDRSKDNNVKYGSFSISSGGYTRSFIAIGSKEKNYVEIEREVLKTLISTTLKNVKIKDPNEQEKENIIKAIESISPIGKGEIFLIPTDKGISLNEGIYLGKTFDGAYVKDVYLSKKDLESHIAIFGSTGSGKSTTAATIAYRASSYYDVLILDWTGEFSDIIKESNVILPKDFNIDPFKLEEFNKRIDILIDSLSNGLGLTQPQQYLLMKVIQEEKPKSISDLIDKIEKYGEEARWDRDVKRGLLRKVENLRNIVKNENNKKLELKNGINILRLSDIDGLNSRKSYALLFLAMVYLNRKREDKNLLIVIDEVQNYFDIEGSSLIEQMMAQSRKYGLSLIVSTQSPALIPNSLLLNANTKIIHALRSARDKEIIYLSMNLNHELNNQLDKLEVGEALIQSPSITDPIIIKVDIINKGRDKINKSFIEKPVYSNSKVKSINFIKDDI